MSRSPRTLLPGDRRPAGAAALSAGAVALCAGLLLALPVPALAHHGKAFLLAESYDLPGPREIYLVPAFDYVDGSDGHEMAVSPSVLFGVTPRFALEVHGHFEKLEGESWEYEATAPAFHVRFGPPGASRQWRTGLSAEYEIARDEAAKIASRPA